MPVIQSKQCSSDKPAKYETSFMSRAWYIHKPCPNCDTKRSTPCQNCQSK